MIFFLFSAFSLSVSLVMANPSCYFDIRSKSDAIGNDFLAKMNVSIDQLECRGNNNTTVSQVVMYYIITHTFIDVHQSRF